VNKFFLDPQKGNSPIALRYIVTNSTQNFRIYCFDMQLRIEGKGWDWGSGTNRVKPGGRRFVHRCTGALVH
jgi:hypothetical protein